MTPVTPIHVPFIFMLLIQALLIGVSVLSLLTAGDKGPSNEGEEWFWLGFIVFIINIFLARCY